jgi:hypothetical protein
MKEATDCLVSLISSNQVLDFKDLTDIGNLLFDYILTLRHRGAYSAVQYNFAQVCQFLANQNRFKNSQLILMEWLEAFLEQLDCLTVSITRRSAGLPAAIVSVITSPSSESLRTTFLEAAMKKLEVCMANNTFIPNGHDHPHIHALNVFKALVQDSKLSSLMRKHLASIFEICIKQFCSSFFPIRNCAGMLFSAIVEKSLGARKTKNVYDSVNLVACTEFFGRYPKIYNILQSELRTAVKDIENV